MNEAMKEAQRLVGKQVVVVGVEGWKGRLLYVTRDGIWGGIKEASGAVDEVQMDRIQAAAT